MSASVCVDSVDWLGDDCVSIGDEGFGVLGSSIPSTGANGPGFAYNDLALPADASKEICGRITTWPTNGTLYAYEDTSFTYSRVGNGIDSFQYQLYVDGAPIGSPQTVTLQIGSANATATGATIAATSTITAGSAAGTAAGTAPGATLVLTSTIDGGSAHSAVVNNMTRRRRRE